MKENEKGAEHGYIQPLHLPLQLGLMSLWNVSLVSARIVIILASPTSPIDGSASTVIICST